MAARAPSSRATPSHWETSRVLPVRRLPADWSLPGHWPAHDARCRELAKRVMSAPISPITHSAPAALDAGDRAEQLNRRRERADLLLDHCGELLDLLIEKVDVAQDRTDPQPVVGV